MFRILLFVSLLWGCRTKLPYEGQTPKFNSTANYDRLLQKIVSPDGHVDYDTLRQNRSTLESYLLWISEPRRAPRKDHKRLSFWINAYNAIVLYQVLALDVHRSVMEIEGLIPEDGAGFFLEHAVKVNGEWLSLWEIEHEKIRMFSQDPRIHAALNCASNSCPPLQNTLYRGPVLNHQLNEQMKRWLRDEERGLRVVNQRAELNPIFEWFERDFLFWTNSDNLCEYLPRFVDDDMASHLDPSNCDLAFYDYDWSLNEQR